MQVPQHSSSHHCSSFSSFSSFGAQQYSNPTLIQSFSHSNSVHPLDFDSTPQSHSNQCITRKRKYVCDGGVNNASCPSTIPPSSFSSECCICLDPVNLPVQLTCGHSFCFLCIKSVCCEVDSIRARCPLCRAVVDRDELKNLELNSEQFVDEHSNIEFVWQYAGRSGGWWIFDDVTNQLIEDEYHLFTQQNQQFITNQTIDQKISDQSNSTCGQSTSSLNSVHSSFSSPSTSNSSLTVSIGHKIYVIDFLLLQQWNQSEPLKKRRIRRITRDALMLDANSTVTNSNQVQSVTAAIARTISLTKGQAGVHFSKVKTKSKK